MNPLEWFFVVIYTQGTKFFSLLGLYFGDTTWKIVTCTWLNAVEFLTKEPPTGSNTGSILSAAISGLVSFSAKQEGGN